MSTSQKKEKMPKHLRSLLWALVFWSILVLFLGIVVGAVLVASGVLVISKAEAATACRLAKVNGATVGGRAADVFIRSCVQPDGAAQVVLRSADCSQAYCREYQSVSTVGENVESTYGTALHRPDGSWEVVDAGGAHLAPTQPQTTRYVVPQAPQQVVVVQRAPRIYRPVPQRRQQVAVQRPAYRPAPSYGTGYSDPTLRCNYQRNTTRYRESINPGDFFERRYNWREGGHSYRLDGGRAAMVTLEGMFPRTRTTERERCGQNYETYGRGATMHGERVLY